MEQGDVVEYWKSAPYLFNFMDNYALKQAFKDAPEKDKMVGFVREFPETFLDLERARAYQPVEPANPRLRELLSETVDRGMWRLLWMPPSLGYYTLDGTVRRSGIGQRDKAAGLLRLAHGSARRRVARFVRSGAPDDAGVPSARARLTQDDWKKQRGLLRFTISDDRLTGLPVLLLIYPCLTFARDCDPRELARGARLTAAEVRSQFAVRIKGLIEKLGIVQEPTTSTDDRWYWLAPMLLDFAEFPVAAQEWWDRAELAQTWAGIEAGDEDDGWSSHVEQAKQTLDSIRSGKEHLGTPPDDLLRCSGPRGLRRPGDGRDARLRACKPQ